MCVLSRFSHVLFFATPWTVARQAALSVGFSRQKYWSGLPCPPPGELPDLCLTWNLCLMSPALAGGFFTTSATWEAHGLLSTAFFSGKNTGAGSLSLLQGIFPTQGSNPGLLYCRQILYQLSYQGNYKLKFSFKKCDLQCLLHRFGVKSFTILSHIKY